jgi:hypothetical protein
MPSGKQVLLYFLEQYSQKLQNDEDLEEVSENLRIALLLHGSTATDMWFNVEKIGWISESDEYGGQRQGLGLKGKQIFLSDLFDCMTSDAEMPEQVKAKFPQLTQAEFDSAIHILWLQLLASEWHSSYSTIENEGEIDLVQVEKWMKSYRAKLRAFRADPGDYLGIIDDDLKKAYRDRLDAIS